MKNFPGESSQVSVQSLKNVTYLYAHFILLYDPEIYENGKDS